ncbi:uncharacterized protein LOC106004326 [Mustela putorius furo]|uniref:Uncharacterized protein LOC106004326 n=1 Tax=Mustela putorius furo TaxID=9669 RepID=A0A8U0V652_MUSPF|nr:uncharacterized protein LOC106004326 [Mustela putorius furo]XP_044938951.1 uncharacterized protein LOC106004326 [Mustela putorius furo]
MGAAAGTAAGGLLEAGHCPFGWSEGWGQGQCGGLRVTGNLARGLPRTRSPSVLTSAWLLGKSQLRSQQAVEALVGSVAKGDQGLQDQDTPAHAPPTPTPRPLGRDAICVSRTWLRSVHGETEARAHFFPSLFLQASAEITFCRQAGRGQRRVLCANNACLFPGKQHRVTRQLCLAGPPVAGLRAGLPLQQPLRQEGSNPGDNRKRAGRSGGCPACLSPSPDPSHPALFPGGVTSEPGAAGAGGGRRQGWDPQSGPSLPGSNPEDQPEACPGRSGCGAGWGGVAWGAALPAPALRPPSSLLALPRVPAGSGFYSHPRGPCCQAFLPTLPRLSCMQPLGRVCSHPPRPHP